MLTHVIHGHSCHFSSPSTTISSMRRTFFVLAFLLTVGGLVFAQRLQVQERLTAQVADCIWQHLEPKAVAVVIEASHSCMTARGVNTPGVMMTTSRMMGTFRSDERSRREVLALMGF